MTTFLPFWRRSPVPRNSMFSLDTEDTEGDKVVYDTKSGVGLYSVKTQRPLFFKSGRSEVDPKARSRARNEKKVTVNLFDTV